VNHRDGREVQLPLDLASQKPLSGSDGPRRGLWKQDHFKVAVPSRRSVDWGFWRRKENSRKARSSALKPE